MNNTNNHTTSFGQTTASKTSIEAKQRQSHPLKLFQIPVNALNQSVIKKAQPSPTSPQVITFGMSTVTSTAPNGKVTKTIANSWTPQVMNSSGK